MGGLSSDGIGDMYSLWNMQCSNIRKHIPAIIASFPGRARRLHSSEWRAQLAYKPAIDPNQSSIELLSYPSHARAVLGEEYAGQSVAAIIGQSNGFFLGIKRHESDNRSEDFVFHQRAVI